NPEHPDFRQYGRSGGRGQRVSKRVDKSYMAQFPGVVGMIKNACADESTDGIYESIHGMIAEYDDMEDRAIPHELADSDEFSALIAGFGAKIKQYTYEEAMNLPEPMRSKMVEAVRSEEQQMYEKEVWEPADLPNHTEGID